MMATQNKVQSLTADNEFDRQYLRESLPSLPRDAYRDAQELAELRNVGAIYVVAHEHGYTLFSLDTLDAAMWKRYRYIAWVIQRGGRAYQPDDEERCDIAAATGGAYCCNC